jgi:hypothetical protein
MNYGFVASKIDGTEMIFDESNKSSMNIPSEYSYQKYLSPVLDQGSNPICVPCSLSSIIECQHKLNKEKFKFSIDWIWDNRADKKAEGMSIKEALTLMKKQGYLSKEQYKKDETTGNKIMAYARLIAPPFMQRSLIINGPFVLGLMVRDTERNDFWNGSKNFGGHAVSCIGYDKNGFILRNSWGSQWGVGGYTTLPYSDFGKILEAWAIIS